MYGNCLKARRHDSRIDIKENSTRMDIICFVKIPWRNKCVLKLNSVYVNICPHSALMPDFKAHPNAFA
jgi:hypothetical protein